MKKRAKQRNRLLVVVAGLLNGVRPLDVGRAVGVLLVLGHFMMLVVLLKQTKKKRNKKKKKAKKKCEPSSRRRRAPP